MLNLWGISYCILMLLLVGFMAGWEAHICRMQHLKRKAQEEAAAKAVRKQRRVGISYYA